METRFSIKSVTVIQDSKITTEELGKLHHTVNGLETRLKQQGITSAKAIQIATIKYSGEPDYIVGYFISSFTISKGASYFSFFAYAEHMVSFALLLYSPHMDFQYQIHY